MSHKQPINSTSSEKFGDEATADCITCLQGHRAKISPAPEGEARSVATAPSSLAEKTPLHLHVL